jgi:outer membrane protein TolC
MNPRSEAAKARVERAVVALYRKGYEDGKRDTLRLLAGENTKARARQRIATIERKG